MSTLESFLDRTDKRYLKKVAELLATKNLYDTAKPLEEQDRDDLKLIKLGFKKKVAIYFSGLAALTLFGSGDKPNKDEKCALAFEHLLKQGVKVLNDSEDKTAVQIKLLFAYPYSNFMYDLLYLETYDQQYLSAECMTRPNKYEYTFKIEPKLSLSDIQRSTTYHHLQNTLGKIQQFIGDIETSIWNTPKDSKIKSPNNIIVKFCPINMLCCLLRINNVILSDPYIYSKKNENEKCLSLLTPVTWLELGSPNEKKFGSNKIYLPDNEEMQFCSFLSHFKYLWEHPLTLYSTDATEYKRGNKLLYKILEPKRVSYERKGNRILRKLNEKESKAEPALKARSDNWKQFLKSEFLQNCSRIHSDTVSTKSNKEIQPLKIFIIGAWSKGGENDCMHQIKKWIEENLSRKNNTGLQLEPIILQVQNGEHFMPKLYKELNSSHLGIVFQTKDIESNKKDNFSKPNIYLEKGYLMGKLKRVLRKDTYEESETIFVFKEVGVDIESDNRGIGYTEFDINDLQSKLHEFIYWLWNVTQLNKEYALKLMQQKKPKNKVELRQYENNYTAILAWEKE